MGKVKMTLEMDLRNMEMEVEDLQDMEMGMVEIQEMVMVVVDQVVQEKKKVKKSQ